MNLSKGIWGFFGNELRQHFGKFKNHLEIKFKQMKNKKACKKKKWRVSSCFQCTKPVNFKFIFSFFMGTWQAYACMDILYNLPPTATMDGSHDIGLVQELVLFYVGKSCQIGVSMQMDIILVF